MLHSAPVHAIVIACPTRMTPPKTWSVSTCFKSEKNSDKQLYLKQGINLPSCSTWLLENLRFSLSKQSQRLTSSACLCAKGPLVQGCQYRHPTVLLLLDLLLLLSRGSFPLLLITTEMLQEHFWVFTQDPGFSWPSCSDWQWPLVRPHLSHNYSIPTQPSQDGETPLKSRPSPLDVRNPPSDGIESTSSVNRDPSPNAARNAPSPNANAPPPTVSRCCQCSPQKRRPGP